MVVDKSSLLQEEESWESTVKRKQQEYCNLLHSRRNENEFCPPSVCKILGGSCECRKTNYICEIDHLKAQIAYAMYKEAEIGEVEEKKVLAIYDTIKKNFYDVSRINVNFIFVFLRGDDGDIPVFRIKSGGEVQFIDENCRLYKGWEDFQKNNTLRKGDWCYPKGGTYSKGADEKVLVEIGRTPASKVSKQLANVMDYGALALMVGAEVTGAVCLAVTAPVIAPIAVAVAAGVGITAGTYSAVRSGVLLHDRATHGESISVADKRALIEWLNIGGTVFSAVGPSARAVSILSKSSKAAKYSKYVSNGSAAAAAVVNVGYVGTMRTVRSIREDERRQIYLRTARTVGFYFNIVLHVVDGEIFDKVVTRLLLEGFKSILSGSDEERAKLRVVNISTDDLPYVHVIWEVVKKCLSRPKSAFEDLKKLIYALAAKLEEICAQYPRTVELVNEVAYKLFSLLPEDMQEVLRDCYKIASQATKIRRPDDFVSWLIETFKMLKKHFETREFRDERNHWYESRSIKNKSSSSSEAEHSSSLPFDDNLYVFPEHLHKECNGELTDEMCKRLAQNSLKLQNADFPCDLSRTPNEIKVSVEDKGVVHIYIVYKKWCHYIRVSAFCA